MNLSQLERLVREEVRRAMKREVMESETSKPRKFYEVIEVDRFNRECIKDLLLFRFDNKEDASNAAFNYASRIKEDLEEYLRCRLVLTRKITECGCICHVIRPGDNECLYSTVVREIRIYPATNK